VTEPTKPFFLQALDAMRAGDRRSAAALLRRQLQEGNTSASNLGPVAQLAAHIGEVDLAIEAARGAVVPGALGPLIDYWGMLATYGRSEEALAELKRQPPALTEHPNVLHFRATLATQMGRLKEARDLFRRSLAKSPGAMQTWFSLAMIKTFSPGDPDMTAMERLERQNSGPQEALASLHYGLGKAREDCGDIDRAFDHYSKGAAIRRQSVRFDAAQFGRAADQVIRDFTADGLAMLRPSGCRDNRSLFVTGLPRSGTTLTEQILLGHSDVSEGEEVNLFAPTMAPTRGVGLANARAYQERANHADPWGEIGRDYRGLIDQRFRSHGLIVDKSLSQALFTGLMLHSLPDARIVWMRRSAEDVALSCFRTFFATGIPWSWSLTDIADAMRVEDRLFEHWSALFPERILVVQYEELVSAPALWSQRIQEHFGLTVEEGLESASRTGRTVGTASAAQVLQPITTTRIGQATAFERHLAAFRERYYGAAADRLA